MPRLSKIGAAALAAFGWTGLQTVTVDFLVIAGGTPKSSTSPIKMSWSPADTTCAIRQSNQAITPSRRGCWLSPRTKGWSANRSTCVPCANLSATSFCCAPNTLTIYPPALTKASWLSEVLRTLHNTMAGSSDTVLKELQVIPQSWPWV